MEFLDWSGKISHPDILVISSGQNAPPDGTDVKEAQFVARSRDAHHAHAGVDDEPGILKTHATAKALATDDDSFVFTQDANKQHKIDTVAKKVFKIATQFEADKISIFDAEQKLGDLGWKLHKPGTVPLLPDDLVLRAVHSPMTDHQVGSMAELTYGLFSKTGGVGGADLNPIFDALVKEIKTVPKGTEIDVTALVEVSKYVLQFQTSPEKEIRNIFAKGADRAHDEIAWISEGYRELSESPGLLSTYGAKKTFLALAAEGSDTIASGELAAYAKKEIVKDHMNVGEAIDFARWFAGLSMDNRGSTDYVDQAASWTSYNLTLLKQLDGIAKDDRSDLVMVQLYKSLGGARAEAAYTYMTDHYFTGYLGGLGMYGLLKGGATMVETIVDARKAIEDEVSEKLRTMDSPTLERMFTLVNNSVPSFSFEFTTGVDLLGSAASLALGDKAPLGLGSIGATAAFASDPSLDAFIDLGVSLTEEALDISNPLEKAALIADVVDTILDKFGVAAILGPFISDIIHGAADVVQSISDAIDNAIDAVVGLAVKPVVVFGNALIINSAKNFSDLVIDLAKGDWDGVVDAARRFGEQFAEDAARMGEAFVESLKAAAEAAAALLEAAKQAAMFVAQPFIALGQAFESLGSLFSGGLFMSAPALAYHPSDWSYAQFVPDNVYATA